MCSNKSFRVILISSALILVFFLPHSKAQRPDSASLFSQLRTKDEHAKLHVLEKIYRDYYATFPVNAWPYVNQALHLARKLHDREAEAWAYYSTSFYYSCRGMIDSAYYFGVLGLDLSKEIKSNSCLVRGYGRLGSVFNVKGDKAKAVEYLRKALELDSTNKDNIASISFTLGILYGDAGCPEKSVYYYLKALKIREEQHNLIEAGYLYCNLGGLYFQSPDGGKGFHAYDKAIAMFREAKFPKGESYAYNLLGGTCFSKNDFESALMFYRKSLYCNSLDTLTGIPGTVFTLTNIGDLWLKLNRFDSAGYYYYKSLKLIASDKDYIPLACNYLSLGELNTKMKNYKKAIEFLNKGLNYSKMANYRAQWEDAYNLLSECYDAGGDHEKAFYYLKKRNAIKDSIITEKANQAVANMLIRYESGKKDEQIKSLNIDSRDKQIKIRLAILFILIILLLTGLSGYFVWQYYHKKLMPKVRTLDFIQEKITMEKEGDNRRLRALDKVLPPEFRTGGDNPPPVVEVNNELKKLLEELMLKERIFLNENLTLSETAKLLETNTAYLSRLINEYFHVNFSTYVNGYRIEEAKKMILNDQYNNFSMEGIAKSSGFRSKSTFNQVFKNSTGFTPSDFAVRNGKIRA